MSLGRLFEQHPRRTTALALVLVVALGVIDNVTGIEISFSIFYLVPIGLASWYVGRPAGLVVAAISCVTWFLNDAVLVTHHYSNALIPVWNGLMRGGIFAVLATLTAAVRTSMRRTDRAFLHLENAFDEMDRARREQLVLKDRLLSNVSHELRTPLTALHQFLTILKDGLGGELNREQKEYVDIALRNANQLKRMIGDLLESARAEAGKLSVELLPVSLGSLVEEIVRALRSRASEEGIDIVVEVADDLPPAHADAARIRQVLTNLLDNALKFTPRPGTVTVSVARHPDVPRLLMASVADTGEGIKPEALELIFSRLHQEGESTDSGRKGLGLGLHICREIVQRHGGRIWAESEVGRGTTVTFTLPAVAGY